MTGPIIAVVAVASVIAIALASSRASTRRSTVAEVRGGGVRRAGREVLARGIAGGMR